MAMGGFIGSDPSPTLLQLQELIAEGRLRYVLLGRDQGLGGFLGGTNVPHRDGWVRATCTDRDRPIPGVPRNGQRASLYDCAAARPGSATNSP